MCEVPLPSVLKQASNYPSIYRIRPFITGLVLPACRQLARCSDMVFKYSLAKSGRAVEAASKAYLMVRQLASSTQPDLSLMFAWAPPHLSWGTAHHFIHPPPSITSSSSSAPAGPAPLVHRPPAPRCPSPCATAALRLGPRPRPGGGGEFPGGQLRGSVGAGRPASVRGRQRDRQALCAGCRACGGGAPASRRHHGAQIRCFGV